MKINMIVCMASNGVIGKLPWIQRADMKRFNQLTMGKFVICGRETYESMRVLKGREVCVVTSRALNARVADSVSGAVKSARGTGYEEEVWVIGGQATYCRFLKYTDTIYMTKLTAPLKGDTVFPWHKECWTQDYSKTSLHEADDNNNYGYTFSVWNAND